MLRSQVSLPADWARDMARGLGLDQLMPGEGSDLFSFLSQQPEGWLVGCGRRYARVRTCLYEHIEARGGGEDVVTEVLRRLLAIYLRHQHLLCQDVPLLMGGGWARGRQHLLGLCGHLCARYKLQDQRYIQYILAEYLAGGQVTELTEFFNDPRDMRRCTLFPMPWIRIEPDELFHYILPTDEHVQHLDYFLRHSKHLVFRVEVGRKWQVRQPTICTNMAEMQSATFTNLADFPVDSRLGGHLYTPLTLAAKMPCDGAVKVLLRHGAVAATELQFQDSPTIYLHSPLEVLALEMNDIAAIVPHCELLSAQDAHYVDRIYTYMFRRYVMCLRYMLRAQTFLPISFESGVWPEYSGDSEQNEAWDEDDGAFVDDDGDLELLIGQNDDDDDDDENNAEQDDNDDEDWNNAEEGNDEDDDNSESDASEADDAADDAAVAELISVSSDDLLLGERADWCPLYEPGDQALWCPVYTFSSDACPTRGRKVLQEQLLLYPSTTCRPVLLDARLLAVLPPCLTDALPSLQHQARAAVRRQLRAAGTLPEGVFKLGLSQVLEAFLDLQVD